MIKAVIINLDDYERLKKGDWDTVQEGWEVWLAQNQKLAAEIMREREGATLEVNDLWEQIRTDLETRHDFLLDD